MGGWCILSISPCQPLHAIGYPFDCANIVCLISFPSINQTLKQNYPSKLEKISRFPKEHEPEVFLNTYPHTHIPIYQSSLQCDVCISNHVLTRSVTKRRASLHWKKLSPPLKKCLGHIVCITILFVHATDVKFGSPSENPSPPMVSKAGYGSAGDYCFQFGAKF